MAFPLKPILVAIGVSLAIVSCGGARDIAPSESRSPSHAEEKEPPPAPSESDASAPVKVSVKAIHDVDAEVRTLLAGVSKQAVLGVLRTGLMASRIGGNEKWRRIDFALWEDGTVFFGDDVFGGPPYRVCKVNDETVRWAVATLAAALDQAQFTEFKPTLHGGSTTAFLDSVGGLTGVVDNGNEGSQEPWLTVNQIRSRLIETSAPMRVSQGSDVYVGQR